MKTVRLPIYDENGMELLNEYLEVDLNFFIPLNTTFMSNLARVVEKPRPHVGDIADCGVEDCIFRVMYFGPITGWRHHDNTETVWHNARPKEV